MEIDLSKPKEVILTEWANHIQTQSPELTEEKALEFAKKTMPYLNCPMANGDKVPPMRCMFCSFGHMTDCHFPFTCNEAKCSHYSKEPDYFDTDNYSQEVKRIVKRVEQKEFEQRLKVENDSGWNFWDAFDKTVRNFSEIAKESEKYTKMGLKSQIESELLRFLKRLPTGDYSNLENEFSKR